jgi:hypothetical protein
LATTRLWIANAADNWSDPNAWAIVGGNNAGQAGAPVNGDTLIFNPGQVTGGKTGTNTNATDDMAGLTTLASVTISGAPTQTVTLNQSLTDTTLALNSGTLTVANGQTLTLSGTGNAASTFSGGTLAGPGTVTLSGTANINSSGFTLNNLTFNDNSILNWNGGSPIHTNNATINVKGRVNVPADGRLDYTGPAGGPFGSFNILDPGTFVTTGGQRTEIDIPFNVSTVGTAVQVGSGDILELDGGGASSSQWSVLSSAQLQFSAPVGANATYTWNNGTSFTGLGTTAVLAGTVVIPNGVTVTVPTVSLSGGYVQGPGTLTVNESLNWTAGTVGGDPNSTVTLSLPADAFADLSGLPILDHATFTIAGSATVNLQSATFQVDNGATINNSGIFIILDNSGVIQFNGTVHSQFNNSGTLRKSGGTGTSTIGVDSTHNTGATLDLRSGKFKFTGSKVSVLDGTFGTGGQQIEVANAFEEDGGSVQVGLNGTLTADDGFTQTGGDLSVGGMSSMSVTGDFQESGGTTEVGMSATLSVTGTTTISGGTLTLQGGSLSAGGGVQIQSGGTLASTSVLSSITGDVSNSGTLSLGNSTMAGTLSVTGNYSQTSAATLNVFLAGGSSSSSELEVSEEATLNGTANVAFVNGGTTLPPASFTVLTYGSRSGTFGTLNLPSLSMGTWDPVYDDPPDTLTLYVTS